MKHKFIPMDEAQTPRSGEVLIDRYWVITPDDEIILWQGFAPQCNSNKDVVEAVRDKVWPEYEVRHLSAIYLGWPE